MGQGVFRKEAYLMGCGFDFTVVAETEEEADRYFDLVIGEVVRIEEMLSEWISTSEVSKINESAGVKEVEVSDELLALIVRAKKFSQISNGAFDISFASTNRLWKFDGSMEELPSKDEVEASVRLVNYKNILVDEREGTVFLKEKGMKIGFGSIGKGYAADRGRKILMEAGAKAGIVNASGDLSVWGTKPDGSVWEIGLINPMNANRIVGVFSLEKGAIATSGSYEKYAMIDGKRYAHIINPKTGYPAEGVVSVSVFADSAELANGLSTAVMVLGIENGLFLLNQLPNIKAVIIDEKGKVFSTNNVMIKND